MLKISATVDPASLGDVDPAYFFEMTEALIADQLGEIELVFLLAPCLKTIWSVEEDYANRWGEKLDRIAEAAFERCCRGDPVPEV